MSALVFRQETLTRWTGALLCPDTLIDAENPARAVTAAAFGLRIVEETDDRVCLTKWGADKRAARRTYHATVDDAQKAALRWASRRFQRAIP